MTIISDVSAFVAFQRANQAKTGIYQSSTSPEESIETETSTNWCGYAIEGTNADAGVGTFTVPPILPGVTSKNNNVSIWCGIDGLTSANPTVQQLGVDLAYVNGRVESYAWIEMYPESLTRYAWPRGSAWQNDSP